MPQIVLTEEQVRILAEVKGVVEVLDPQGCLLASLQLLEPGDLEAIERFKRARGQKQPGIPSEQVQAHFRRLEEIRQQEPMDVAKALELLRRMRAGEQV